MSIMITCNRVRAWLKSKWKVTVPNDWLTACVEWIQGENEGLPLGNSDLNQMVYEQWLVSDLRELGAATLPPGLAEQPMVILDGRYCLQVNSLVDASMPFYSQLTKARGKENENVNVSSSTQLTQPAWEVKPSRMLMLTLTDGVQEVQGMEYRSIPSINPQLTAGTKVLVQGEVVCRLGVLMLCPENLSVLGGEVEAMMEENSHENNLQRALEQNRAIDQPRTARKEFQVESKCAQKQLAQKHQQQQQQPHQQQQLQQRHQQQDWRSRYNNVLTDRQPSTDEWGDEDIDMDILGTLDEAELTEEQKRNLENADLEAMMDDDLDDELLASQPEHIMTPQEEWSAPDTGWTTVRTPQLSACTAQSTKPATSQTSLQSVNLQPSVSMSHKDEYNNKITYPKQPTSHANQSNTSHASRLTKPHSTPQNQHQYTKLANPSTHSRLQTHQITQGTKLSHKVSPWKVEPSLDVSSHVASGSSSGIHTNYTKDICKQDPDLGKRIKHAPIDLHSLPFTYLVKVQDLWPPNRLTLVTVKAYVATVLGKLEANDGRNWSLRAKINDGSAAMDVILSDELLTSLIGFSASECMLMRSQARCNKTIKDRLLTGIKSCQDSLINMSAIMEIELDPEHAALSVLRHRQVTPADCALLRDRNGL